MSTPHGPEPEPDGPPPAGLPDHRPFPGGSNDPRRQGPIDPFGGRYPDYPAAEYPNGPGQPAASYPTGPGHPGGDGPAPGDPLVPADFGGWVSKVTDTVRRSFAQMAVVQLLSAAVSVVLGLVIAAQVPSDGALGSPAAPTPEAIGMSLGPTALVGFLVSLAVSAFVWGASIYITVRDAAGTATTAAEGLRFSPRRAAPMFGWGLLAGFLVVLGFIALVLPGIYLAVVLFASLYGVIAVEKEGIGRCFALIRGRFWPTFGRLLVAGIAFGAYAGIVGLVTTALGGGTYGVVKAIVQPLLMVPASVAAVAVAVVTYAELRWHEDRSVTTPGLAAQMVDR